MEWKIGDRVRLVGNQWPTDGSNSVRRGSVHTVTSVNDRGNVCLSGEGSRYHWGILSGWEIELVERKEEKMTVKISDVNVGDRVKLTRKNGDEAVFTVTHPGSSTLETVHNTYYVGPEDTLEIVERAFKPVPGLYSHQKTGARVALLLDGRAYYVHSSGAWIKVSDLLGNVGDAAREKGSWKREITF